MNIDQRGLDSPGEAFAREIWRVEVIKYRLEEACKNTPLYRLTLKKVRMSLDTAYKAVMSGDLPAMVEAYEALKGWKE